jgi:hypothetical protein
MQTRRATSVTTAAILGLLFLPPTLSAAAGAGAVPTARLTHSSDAVRQHLSMSPRCFVAGRGTWAHVTLTHAGPHARVEFIWAPTKGVILGPGFGPGIYRSNAVGGIHFSALSPSRYGRGVVGRWIVAAKWPKAAHAFVELIFKIVPSPSDC